MRGAWCPHISHEQHLWVRGACLKVIEILQVMSCSPGGRHLDCCTRGGPHQSLLPEQVVSWYLDPRSLGLLGMQEAGKPLTAGSALPAALLEL